tara:strand:+ start:747 stop:1457 length:711 start_codon:yes stop_codon:yes gene_type:complete
MDNWKIIWSKKDLKPNSTQSLNNLIVANGFDTGVGSYSEDKWREMVFDFLKRTNFNENANVLELGCGSGAFLFPLNELVKANYFGLDYSPSLINIAKTALPNAHLVAEEAKSSAFDDMYFDVIFSHSVFQYFPSMVYAEDVITMWCKKIKQGGKLVLLDINDKEKEDDYHNERMLAYRNPAEYYKTYEGLSHLFFDRVRLKEILKKCEMKEIEMFPHAVADYGNSKFRFNIICTKI